MIESHPGSLALLQSPMVQKTFPLLTGSPFMSTDSPDERASNKGLSGSNESLPSVPNGKPPTLEKLQEQMTIQGLSSQSALSKPRQQRDHKEKTTSAVSMDNKFSLYQTITHGLTLGLAAQAAVGQALPNLPTNSSIGSLSTHMASLKSTNSSLTIPPLHNTAFKIHHRTVEEAKIHFETSHANLAEVINSAYSYPDLPIGHRGKLDNLEKTLGFIKNLSHDNERITGYSTLMMEMGKNNQLDSSQFIMLAYQIDNDFKKINTRNLSQDQRNTLKELKENIPNSIQILLKDKPIKIKNNRKNLEFIKKEVMDSSPIRYELALNNCPQGNTTSDSSTDWKIRIIDQGRYFEFINVKNNYSMLPDHHFYLILPNKEFTFPSLTEDDQIEKITSNFTKNPDRFHYPNTNHDPFYHWEVVPVNQGKEFYFKNRVTGKILESTVSIWDYLRDFFSIELCNTVRYSQSYSNAASQRWTLEKI